MAGKKNGGPPRASAPTKKGRDREITCRSFVIMPDGRTVPVEDLTDSERETWHAHMRERLSTGLSAYYSQHPEEYARLRCGRVEEEGA